MSTSVGPKAIVKPKAPEKIKPTIFREYIGVKPHLDNLPDFPDIINPNIPEFHFILAFASELYHNNGTGTGDFKRRWIVDYFTAEKINQLKNNPEYQRVKVKVLISIGGVGTAYPFNPAERDVWPDQAIASLRGIIILYGDLIDGIDINYEEVRSTDIDFAHCIGQVISALKEEGLINVVSIAPSEQVQPHYQRLYLEHGNNIDWVNYKFYNQTVPSTDEFIRLYGNLSNVYHPTKLLAGFSTDPGPAVTELTLEVFLGACIKLLYTRSLPGIFVWNANDSYVHRPNENLFQVEDIAQKLLILPLR